ncbi:uncharacterized protein LOC126907546 [Daktulosphaira vitifoliae]|uniref:uncharacterized protein LOC126907546 n=1 Tax=Daktulosphaira vitifoliae TaxID=58002 RepID=UPI0021AB02A4|nr:uncharacterized protein LOC126907546 [Daktulosphaira vitifoliae]
MNFYYFVINHNTILSIVAIIIIYCNETHGISIFTIQSSQALHFLKGEPVFNMRNEVVSFGNLIEEVSKLNDYNYWSYASNQGLKFAVQFRVTKYILTLSVYCLEALKFNRPDVFSEEKAYNVFITANSIIFQGLGVNAYSLISDVYDEHIRILRLPQIDILLKLEEIIAYYTNIIKKNIKIRCNEVLLQFAALSISNVKPQFKDVYESILELIKPHKVSLNIGYAFSNNDKIELVEVTSILYEIQCLMKSEYSAYNA